jgi:hypothetical protein
MIEPENMFWVVNHPARLRLVYKSKINFSLVNRMYRVVFQVYLKNITGLVNQLNPGQFVFVV